MLIFMRTALVDLLRTAAVIVVVLYAALSGGSVFAAVTELNSTGGTSASNGLHFYLEDTSHIQVRRLNNSGQVYWSGAVPPSTNLDNGVFLRANGAVYGPSNWAFTLPMFSTYSITGVSPANPATLGVPQIATQALGITSGPQVSIVWKYVLPYDFITAEVTLTIPSAYAVSASNPVRYYHVFDTYLGGSDRGCGVTFVDANGKRVVGTYPPPSGTTCPSSTSIPSSVSVVESFRERSGLGFSHYCTNAWSNFWETATSGTACAIRRLTSLNDAVTTTYQDTGIGIEYDFAAPGTYTFSYDFVIGSPTVPPYDHLEIQHDGNATLCPENITVLACTSSAVPCPPANYVVTGNLTGKITETPTTPAVTETPATFALGSSASTATVALQGTAPGGTYTLGSSGLSAIPLNGTRCWNTSTNTASCTLTISNTPCVAGFECLESGLAYNNLITTPSARNPLYTKLSDAGFDFDVVALQSSGDQATGYVSSGTVTVELFDDSVPAASCGAYASPVASQTMTFAAADNGRKTIPSSFNLAKAFGKLRCRVTDSTITPTVYGCSSDDFTLRPQAFSAVSSSNANADSAGLSATAVPLVKTGAAFTLVADTGVAGYNNTPKANPGRLEWTGAPAGGRASPGSGTLDGAIPGNLVFSAASATTGNGASGSFVYDEAGYFRFKTYGIYDDTFASFSDDIANGDCVSGSATLADNYANTAASGKYGCYFGNTVATSHFGRFVPDHFDTTVKQACAPGSFSYSAQPFPLTVTARNLTGGTTQNYTGSFAKAVSLIARDTADTTDNPGPGTLTSATIASTAFAAGVANQSPAYTLTTAQTAPTSVRIRAQESEVSSLRSPSALTVEGGAAVRSGRARLSNAYGSEMLDLPVPFRAEYWNGTGWVLNTADSCTGDTTLSAANAVSLALVSAPASLTCIMDNGNPELSGAGCGAAASPAKRYRAGATPALSPAFAGDFNLWLRAPGAGKPGNATVKATVPAWLGVVPPARILFGVYKSPLIYRREVFQ